MNIDFQSLFASGAFTRQQVETLKRLATDVFADAVASADTVGFGLDCGDASPNSNGPAKFDMGSSA